MSEIQEAEWELVETFFESRFGKVPDLQAMLYLIGVNELGHFPERKRFTKEQKQDLMHLAVCKLLVPYDYFVFEKFDDEGWPHYLPVKRMESQKLKEQEDLLKKAIILYINTILKNENN